FFTIRLAPRTLRVLVRGLRLHSFLPFALPLELFEFSFAGFAFMVFYHSPCPSNSSSSRSRASPYRNTRRQLRLQAGVLSSCISARLIAYADIIAHYFRELKH